MFKPKEQVYFYRFIGIKDKDQYNNDLKLLQSKCDEIENKVIVFDNEMPLSGEMELIQYIYNELQTMDISNLINQDIVIFDDYNTNYSFVRLTMWYGKIIQHQ